MAQPQPPNRIMERALRKERAPPPQAEGINILDAAGGAAGPFITGLLYDRTGSYFVSFVVITGMLLVATVAASMLKIDQADYPDSASEPV